MYQRPHARDQKIMLQLLMGLSLSLLAGSPALAKDDSDPDDSQNAICAMIAGKVNRASGQRVEQDRTLLRQAATSILNQVFSKLPDSSDPQAMQNFLQNMDNALDQHVGLTATLESLNNGAVMDEPMRAIQARAESSKKISKGIVELQKDMGVLQNPGSQDGTFMRIARGLPGIGAMISKKANQSETPYVAIERVKNGLLTNIGDAQETHNQLGQDSVQWVTSALAIRKNADLIHELAEGFKTTAANAQDPMMGRLCLVLANKLGEYEEAYRFMENTLLTSADRASEVQAALREVVRLARTHGLANLASIQANLALSVAQSVATGLLDKVEALRTAAAKAEQTVAQDFKAFSSRYTAMRLEGPADPKLSAQSAKLWADARGLIANYEANSSKERDTRLKALAERNRALESKVQTGNATALLDTATQRPLLNRPQ